MKEKNQHILKKKIARLPNYTPPSEIWDNIKNEFSFEERLNETLKQLPEYLPQEKIWKSISSELNQTHKIIGLKPIIRTIVWVSTGVAASVVALLLIKNVFTSTGSGVKISYSEETVCKDKMPVNEPYKEIMALEFIKEQCRRNEITCSSTDFQDKIKELEKVDNELKKVNEMEMLSGSSSALITSEIKLTNLRSQLIKELINYFTS